MKLISYRCVDMLYSTTESVYKVSTNTVHKDVCKHCLNMQKKCYLTISLTGRCRSIMLVA